jgi:hypothetical protein
MKPSCFCFCWSFLLRNFRCTLIETTGLSVILQSRDQLDGVLQAKDDAVHFDDDMAEALFDHLRPSCVLREKLCLDLCFQ